MVVQRGNRGAGRGGQHDPADFRGRPRDRRDADRLRLRQARADADRRRRDGGAGPRRADRRAPEQGTPGAGLLAARAGPPPHRVARRRSRLARRRRTAGDPAPTARRLCGKTAAGAARQRADPPHPVFARRRAACAAASPRQCRAPPRAARRLHASPRHRAQDLQGDSEHAHRSRPRADDDAGRPRQARGAGARSPTRGARLDRAYQLLRAFSYQSVLERGFALIRDDGGHPLRSAAAVQPGMALDIEFADGCVGATAQSVRNVGEAKPTEPRVAPAWKPRKPKSGSGGGGQGSLFG